MVDCPCGFGKNIAEDQKSCPICGTDLAPLHRLKSAPRGFYDQAMKFLADGREGEAMERLMAAVTLDAGFAQSHGALARLLAKKGLFDEAMRHFDLALASDPGNESLREEKAEATRSARNQPARKERRAQRSWVIGIAGFLLGAVAFPLVQSVTKKPPVPPTKERLAVQLRAALSENPSFANSVLQVGQSPEGLFIEGDVPSVLHKCLASEIARNVAGGTPVNCEKLRVTPPQPETPKHRNFFLYTVKEGDCLGAIAAKFYGQESLWRRIYDANKDKLSSPDGLRPGQALAIPLAHEQGADAPEKR